MGSIKSQPVYRSLSRVPGAKHHVFASAGEGAISVKQVLEDLALNELSLAVLHWEIPATGNRYAALLENEFGAPLEVFPTEAGLMGALAEKLAQSPAGTVLYLSGPEQFIWKAAALGRSAGMSRAQMQAELRGSRARRVYCVHCKAINEGVTHSIHRCAGCGLPLCVRDHYSRLMEAYAGFRIDAEEPGNVPEAEELYA
ncbi:MAG TPA: dimethylamine monooxygenase subunit DmmA family protein [Chthoniobacterales bacterium]